MKSANPIHLLERDYFLHLDRSVPVWPPEKLDLLDPTKFGNDGEEASGNWLAGEWNRGELPESAGGYLWRMLEEAQGRNDTRLCETILRFPSAPLFGSQSKTGYQVEMKPVHQHTMRFLRSTTQADGPKITRFSLCSMASMSSIGSIFITTWPDFSLVNRTTSRASSLRSQRI